MGSQVFSLQTSPSLEVLFCNTAMGWLRLVGSLKVQVSFAEYRLFYRALLQKRPIILRSLLIVAAPYTRPECAAVWWAPHNQVSWGFVGSKIREGSFAMGSFCKRTLQKQFYSAEWDCSLMRVVCSRVLEGSVRVSLFFSNPLHPIKFIPESDRSIPCSQGISIP